jgi:hypothetical protein
LLIFCFDLFYIFHSPDADGYWCNRDLVKQLNDAMGSINAKFDAMIVDGAPLAGRYEFIAQFDNSGNHGASAPDALIAKRLNVSDGWPEQRKGDVDASGGPVAFRDGWWIDANNVRHEQSFVRDMPDGKGGFVRKHKGLETILKERGLWRAAHQAGALNKKKMSKQEAIDTLDAQPDFLAHGGKTWLQETCDHLSARHSVSITCVYGVKFHPELSAIENYWGDCKKFTRSRCDYSLKTLRLVVPEALKLVGGLSAIASERVERLGTLRRHFAHVERYMDAYEHGTLTLAQVEWCMHQYTSHRRHVDCNYTDAAYGQLNESWLSAATLAQMPDDLKEETAHADDENVTIELNDDAEGLL